MHALKIKVLGIFLSLLVAVAPAVAKPHNPVGKGREYGTAQTLLAVVKARHKADLKRYKFFQKQRRAEHKRVVKLRKKKKKEAAKREKELAKLRKKHAKEVAKRKKIRQKKELAKIKQAQESSDQKEVNGDGPQSDTANFGKGGKRKRKRKTFWGRFWSSIISG